MGFSREKRGVTWMPGYILNLSSINKRTYEQMQTWELVGDPTHQNEWPIPSVSRSVHKIISRCELLPESSWSGKIVHDDLTPPQALPLFLRVRSDTTCHSSSHRDQKTRSSLGSLWDKLPRRGTRLFAVGIYIAVDEEIVSLGWDTTPDSYPAYQHDILEEFSIP